MTLQLIRGFNPTQKAATANGVVQWTGSDIPHALLREITIAISGGTGGAFHGSGGAERYVIKAGNKPFVDITYLQLAALLARFNPNNYEPVMGTVQIITIPLWTLGAPDLLSKLASGSPNDTRLTVEVYMGASVAGAVVCTIGWGWHPMVPKATQMLLNQSLDFVVSKNNNREDLTQEGNFRGFTIKTLGLQRYQLTLNGKVRHDMAGPAASTDPDYIYEMMRAQGGSPDYTIATDHLYIDADFGEGFLVGGQSHITCDTSANYSVTAANNRVLCHTAVDANFFARDGR